MRIQTVEQYAPSFGYLDASSPLSRTVWGGLGGTDLPGEMHHWRWVLRLEASRHFQFVLSNLCLRFKMAALSFLLLLPCLVLTDVPTPLWTLLSLETSPKQTHSCVNCWGLGIGSEQQRCN